MDALKLDGGAMEAANLSLLPLERRTIPELLGHARAFGDDRLFFMDLDSGTSLTYGAFLSHVSGLARRLSQMLPAGATVATLISNRAECVILRFALSCAGICEAAINGEHRGAVLKSMLEVAGPQAIICEEKFRAGVEASGFPLDDIRWIGEAELAELCRLHAPWDQRPRPAIRPGDPCRIIFTSGTSGVSKGAELSHAYEVFTGSCYAQRVGLTPDDRWYYVTPFFHIDSVLSLAAVLHGGGAFILAPRFSASRYWEDAIAAQATVIIYVGSILAILRKRGAPPPGHKIRVAVGVGGTAGLRDWFEGEHNIPLLEIYGLTECAAPAIDDHAHRRPGSCGRPLKGYEIAIVDEFDAPLSARQKGQIAIRPTEPYGLFSGYRNHSKATVECFRNLWFHTGDMGSKDEDGFVYFHGRMKNVIRHRDENISAEELEAVVDTHPAILISAAVGVPSELGDEDILLYVQPKPGSALDPAEIMAYLAGRIAPFMLPHYIQVVEHFALTPSEKVAKAQLAKTPAATAWKRPRKR
jgi:carnitine-CoA ligase